MSNETVSLKELIEIQGDCATALEAIRDSLVIIHAIITAHQERITKLEDILLAAFVPKTEV